MSSSNPTAPPLPPDLSSPHQSPTPPPPTISAPGPRAAALQTAFSRALDATLSKVSHDNFAACFPTTATNRPETVRVFWRDFVERLRAVCQRQFDGILAEREVVVALNALDALVGEARARKEGEQARGGGGGGAEVPVP
jgi:kinetochore protein NNF1